MIDEKLYEFLKAELHDLGISVKKDWGGRQEEVFFQRLDNSEDYYWVSIQKLNTVDLLNDMKKEYLVSPIDESDILWNKLIDDIKPLIRKYKISNALS
jgi:hypothetical protein